MWRVSTSMLVIILALGVCNPTRSLGQTPGAVGSGGAMYMGVGSCTNTLCHGSVREMTASQHGIRQNEYTHWVTKDKHARAYDVLRTERSLRIARHLHMPETEPPEQSPRCLVCHAVYVPKALQGPKYQLEDGVGCEACHGAAQGWLSNHVGREYQAVLQEGMYDTRNLVKRAETCVSCHVGDATRHVDHELMAAGHPDLVFELDTFTHLLPPHWRLSQEENSGKAWVIGQAVALRESLHRLARRTQQRAATAWPEFAEFECFACHHEVNNITSSSYRRGADQRLQPGPAWLASWREARGYTGSAGLPPWNPARYFLLRQFVQATAPARRGQFEQEMQAVQTLMTKVAVTDPAQITAAATRAAHTVDALLATLMPQQIDAGLAHTLLASIASDGPAIASAGFRVAEQAAMALQTFALLAHRGDKPLQEVIDQLFQTAEKPATYNPQQFAAQMRTIHRLLTR